MALIGLGLDLVDIADARKLLDRWGERLLRRLLTDREREYVVGSGFPAQHLAVRLAAKEAVYKALQALPGARGIRWRQIEVIRHSGGRPSIQLHDEAAAIAARGGINHIALSLSHTTLTAGAVAVLESQTPRATNSE